MKDLLIRHYDALIEENNDPVLDPPALRAYMDLWDGQPFLDALELTGQENVLEIGVGTGRLAVRTALRCGSFTGIDLSPRTIARATEHLDPSTTLITGDFLTHPFQVQFDLIYSSLTFFHIEDKQAAADRVFQLLRPHGRFVLSISKSQDTVLDYGIRRLPLFPDTPEQMCRHLQIAGFHVNSITETEFAYIIQSHK